MNLKKALTFVGLLFLTLAVVSAFVLQSPECEKECLDCYECWEGCTSILVGKNASNDGSTMTTHTCDCGVCDWTFRFVSAADYKEGDVRKIYHINQYVTWPPEQGLKWEKYKDDYADLDIPQVPRTFAYIHGMFGYMNENQVALGESSIGCQRKMRNPTFMISKAESLSNGKGPIRRAREVRTALREEGAAYGVFSTSLRLLRILGRTPRTWISHSL